MSSLAWIFTVHTQINMHCMFEKKKEIQLIFQHKSNSNILLHPQFRNMYIYIFFLSFLCCLLLGVGIGFFFSSPFVLFHIHLHTRSYIVIFEILIKIFFRRLHYIRYVGISDQKNFIDIYQKSHHHPECLPLPESQLT